METNQRSTRRLRLPNWAVQFQRLVVRAVTGSGRKVRGAYRRIRGTHPAVVVDAAGLDARRIRRLMRRTAHSHARALGIEVPDGLSIIVQRYVLHQHQIDGRTQAFEDAGGRRHWVIQLARSVDGREVTDDELAAALRHQLATVLEELTGPPAFSLVLDLDGPRDTRIGGSIVDLCPPRRASDNGHKPDPFTLPTTGAPLGGGTW